LNGARSLLITEVGWPPCQGAAPATRLTRRQGLQCSRAPQPHSRTAAPPHSRTEGSDNGRPWAPQRPSGASQRFWSRPPGGLARSSSGTGWVKDLTEGLNGLPLDHPGPSRKRAGTAEYSARNWRISAFTDVRAKPARMRAHSSTSASTRRVMLVSDCCLDRDIAQA
jgi:hypothetical protein